MSNNLECSLVAFEERKQLPHRVALSCINEFHHRVCPAAEETKGEREEQPQAGLLAGIVMVMVIMGAAVLVSVYVYNHPTSSVSLFFMEVSDNNPLP